MAKRDFGPWTYTSNGGRTYVRRADKFLTAQNDGATPPLPLVGGGDASNLTPYEPMPSNLRPRVAIMTERSTGYTEAVVIYDKATLAALPADFAMNVRDASGAVHACVLERIVGEKFGRRIKPAS